jgi:hypothetical protein
MSRKQFRFHAPVMPALLDGDIRYSEKFHWHQRELEDRNSVYSHEHGEVAFAHALSGQPGDSSATQVVSHTQSQSRDGSSVHDDSTANTSVKYYFISDNSVSQEANCTSGQTVVASLSTYPDMPSDICYSDEFASDNALRSNFFSVGSTRTNKLVRVKMERYRKVKHLQGKHVKGLSLESRQTQLMRRNEQHVQKLTRPHSVT